jgi:uncharacterized protein
MHIKGIIKHQMKVFVSVKTRSKQEEVEEVDEDHLKIRVKELPVDGKANKRVLRLVADHFKVPLSDIKIVSGGKSSKKIIKIYK